jgi:Flp pilus assembly protein TadD
VQRQAQTSPPPAGRHASAGSFPVSPRIAASPTATSHGRAAPSQTAEAGGNSHLARFNEGIAARERGDWESAARLFQEVVSLDPSIVEGWNCLGNALTRLGKLPDADKAFRKALSLDPNYPAALSNSGILRLNEGRPGEAAALFARAAALDPRNPAPRVNLAISQARLGALGEAEETLAAARRAFPSNPDVLYHLGTVYERAGDLAKAGEAYASFLAVSNGRMSDKEMLVRERLKELRGDVP